MRGACLIYRCDTTHSYVWHDGFISVTWLIHMCGITHSYVWRWLQTRLVTLDSILFCKKHAKVSFTNIKCSELRSELTFEILSARVCCFQWFGSSLMSIGSNLQVWCTSSSWLLQVIVAFDGSVVTTWRFAALWCVREVLVMFIALYRHMWQSSFWKLSVEYWNTSLCVVKSKGVAYWKSSSCLLQVIVPCAMEIKWQS